jgi:hypothetical protein
MLGMLSVIMFGLTLALVFSPKTPIQPPSPTEQVFDVTGLEVQEVGKVIVKMVPFPKDRTADFTVVSLDGRYPVYFSKEKCENDVAPFMYGPYDSILHCPIEGPDVIAAIVSDQVWLEDRLVPFKQYLSCINGWVYKGRDANGKESWFVEMFGFQTPFC